MVKRPEKPPIQPAREDDGFRTAVAMKHEKLIGRFVVAWSKLENAIDDLIWHLLDLPVEYGRVITTRLDATGKIRILKALGDLTYTESERSALNETIGKIELLKDDRNFIIHGTWGTSKLDNEPLALSLRPKSDPSKIIGETFPEARMREILDATEARKAELIAFRDSPSTPHPQLSGRRRQ
jgi:hypothetical protein